MKIDSPATPPAGPTLREALRQAAPVLRTAARWLLVLNDYIRGQLLLGLAVGAMVGGGLVSLRMLGFDIKYIMLLAIIAGVTELIPIIGPIIGESIGIHPAILTVVLIAMGQIFGLLGGCWPRRRARSAATCSPTSTGAWRATRLRPRAMRSVVYPRRMRVPPRRGEPA